MLRQREVSVQTPYGETLNTAVEFSVSPTYVW